MLISLEANVYACIACICNVSLCVCVCMSVSEWLNEHAVRLAVVCVDGISENARATAVWHRQIQLQMHIHILHVHRYVTLFK